MGEIFKLGQRRRRPEIGSRTRAGMTSGEVLVTLFVLAVLFFLLVGMGTPTHTLVKGQMTQTLSNMRQLQLATQQMALDREATGEKVFGWPEDIGGTFTNWARQLVPAYLNTNDFCKLLSTPGRIVPAGKIPGGNTNGVLVYAIGKASSADAVFLTSGNFTNTSQGGAPLDKKAKPYGDKGFVVFRKGGDGVILLRSQVGKTNIIGASVPLLR